MIMGGNQPYFMPYIGYWQLINAVDVFIISDDYNYIEGGWIGRNRILENGQSRYFNIEISHATSIKKINELYLSTEKFDKGKKLKQLWNVYRKAPYFDVGYALMEQVFDCKDLNLAYFLENSIRVVCNFLDIKTRFVRSSSIQGNCLLKRENKIFDQCRSVGADCYINAVGGKKLYSFEQFRQHGIRLGFIQTDEIAYKQLWYDFVPNLSIIDVIMFNQKADIQEMLSRYSILWNDGITVEHGTVGSGM